MRIISKYTDYYDSLQTNIERSIMIPVLITIKNGVVEKAVICKSSEELESLFVKENQDYGRETNEDEMDNGYVELEDVTICMTWATNSDSVEDETSESKRPSFLPTMLL